ncbi:MAG: glycosyltransferase family 39 protein [Zetaproteobacteria bacterium]|nr:MAG: glycosyltransferase family 39 protein [Zetaproteobacteria bacterium]
MPSRNESLKWWPWLLGLLCIVDFLVGLGGHALWDVDEPNNAVCAREMLEARNWWVPVFNGDLRYDKPILLYWLLMPAYALFGVSEWTARLPSALAMTVMVFVIVVLTRRLSDERTGLMAGTLFASALHIVLIARACVPDPLLMLSLGTALPMLLLHYLEHRSASSVGMNRELVCAYAAIGFGVLAKGPVAVVMPVLIVGLFLLLMGELRHWRLFLPFRGLAIVALVALPWYITVGVLTDGDWLRGFIMHHNIDRFTGALQGHHGFPGYYVLTMLAGWFPWTGLLLAALVFGPWHISRLRRDPVRLFLLSWILIYLIFFSIARTQLPNYMLPSFMAAAMLMAVWWRDADAGLRQRARRWTLVAAVLMAIGICAGGGYALQRQWPGEWVYLLGVLAVVVAAVTLRRNMLASLAAGMAVFITSLTLWALPAFDEHKATPVLARAATSAGFGPDALATYHYFQPSLLFYHGGRLPVLEDQRQLAEWLAHGRAVVMPASELSGLPDGILPYVVVYARVHGLYARKWLVLISLQPVGGAHG